MLLALPTPGAWVLATGARTVDRLKWPKNEMKRLISKSKFRSVPIHEFIVIGVSHGVSERVNEIRDSVNCSSLQYLLVESRSGGRFGDVGQVSDSALKRD